MEEEEEVAKEDVRVRKRRSSILKLPKSRNPLEDVDYTETLTDINISRAVRRVSFASSNFIKPFVADPEQNTIWDQTYEEDVNQTNSTQSSQEQSANSSSKTVSVYNASERCGDATIRSEASIELTNLDLIADKENLVYPLISIVDYAKKMAPKDTNTNTDIEIEKSTKLSSTMEITCVNFDASVAKIENMDITTQSEEEMDICISPRKALNMEIPFNQVSDQNDLQRKLESVPSCVIKNQEYSQTNMEFTCQVDTTKTKYTKNNLQERYGMEFTCKLPTELNFEDSETNTCNVSSAMDFTCRMPIERKNDFQLDEFAIENTKGMEFTCQVNAQKIIETGSKLRNRNINTTMKDDICDLNFTCQKQKRHTTNCQINEKTTEDSVSEAICHNVNMELTSQMSTERQNDFQAIKMIDEPSIDDTKGMEFTCQVNAQKIIERGLKFRDRNINTTLKDSIDDMEFTCQLQKKHRTSCQINEKTTENSISEAICHNVSSGMEFTCQIPTERKNDSQVNQMTDKSSIDDSKGMEFTCQIKPQKIIETLLKSGDENINATLKSNRQVQRIHPTSCQINEEKNKNTNENHISHRMEISQQMYTENREKEGISMTKNYINSEMEFTGQVNIENTENDKNVLQEQTFKSDRMDFTFQIQGKISVNEENRTFQKNMNLEKSMTNEIILEKPLKQANKFDEISPNSMLFAEQGRSTPMYKKFLTVSRANNTEQLNFTCNSVFNTTNVTEKSKDFANNEVNKTLDESKLKSYSAMEIDEINLTEKVVKTHLCNTNDVKSNNRSELVSANLDEIENKEKKQSFVITDAEVSLPRASQFMDQSNLGEQINGAKNNFTDDIQNDSHVFNTSLTNSKVSHIPIRRKSAISHSPELSKAKKNCQLQKPLMSLGASTSTVNKSRRSLFKSILSSTTSKHDMSEVKTPEVSFHINLTNISSGVDDTQQLLQCTYSKPNPIMCKNKDQIENISENNLTDVKRVTEDKDNIDESFIDYPKLGNKLINDTYCLRGVKEESQADKDMSEDSSLGLIADECLSSFTDETFGKPKSCSKPFKLEKFELKIEKRPEIAKLIKDTGEQRKEIANYLQNIVIRPINIPEDFFIEKIPAINNTDASENSNNKGTNATSSLEDIIRQREKSCEKCWKLEKVENNLYHFSTLFGTLVFVADINIECNKVRNIQIIKNLEETAQPIAKYILKLLIDRLGENRIRLAIGENYDILSLLDYVETFILQMNQFQKDLHLCDEVTIDDDFRAKFKIICVPLGIYSEVFVYVGNIDCLEEDDIKILNHIGKIDEKEVKKLAKNCPRTLDFFINFFKNITLHIKSKIR